jgi:hypothetical protein
MFDAEVDAAIQKLIAQWNIAERRIKKAEQVRANEVVAAAIFELRYAGRKYIDASHLLIEAPSHPATKNQVLEYLADATEDCVKAKHDAIDAMLDFITSWLDRTETKLGLSAVVRFFPNYIEITAKISTIQDKIEASRADRTKLRDSIYDEIENADYDSILHLYTTMRQSEERIQAEVDAEAVEKEQFRRRQEQIHYEGRVNILIGAAGLIMAIVGIVLAVAAIFKPDIPPHP